MAAAIAIVVFAGFAPTYHLRGLSETAPLPVLVHIHGLAFTAWTLLLMAQVGLVEAGRRDVHRRLGVIGAVLAGAMIGLGVAVALAAARREVAAGNADEALAFLIIPLGGMVAFGALVGAGVLWRRRPEVHRRLMVLATLAILPAAIGRIPGLDHPLWFSLVFGGLLAAAPIHDLVSGRRPHPLSLWGGIGLYLWELGRFMAQGSAWWRAIAERLV